MKKYIISIILFATFGLNVTFAQSGQSFDLDFVYCKDGCNEDQLYAKVNNFYDNFVYPYASLRLSFNHVLSDAERELFVDEFRLLDSAGTRIQHLHEKLKNLPALGRHGSFNWLNNGYQLVYTAASLSPAKNYTIQMPDGWSNNQNIRDFWTTPFTGEGFRTYEVFCHDVNCFDKFSKDNYSPSESVDKSYSDVTFNDAYANKEYRKTEMKIRGNTSSFPAKKSFTVKFNSNELFEGFQDSSGIYQGARKKLVFVAHIAWSQFSMSNNKLMYDVARKLEKRILGAELAADSYFAALVLNGRFWGVYNVTEHISTGKGGWSTMKDRKEVFGFNAKGKGMLHKATLHGENVGGNYKIESKTDHEYDFGIRGDGSHNYDLTLPYKPLVLIDEKQNDIEFDFKISVKKPKLKLKPNLNNFEMPNFPLIGDGNGLLTIDEVNNRSNLQLNFSKPVNSGEKITAEFNTTYDFSEYYKSASMDGVIDYYEVSNWFNVDSSLISMFVIKLSGSWDHGQQNRFMFSKEKSLDAFANANRAPNGHLYYDIIWDGDIAFVHDHCVANFLTDDCTRPTPDHWKSIALSQEGRQRYIDLFYIEKEEGGVLTPGFYEKQISKHLQMMGNALDLEAIRWSRQFNYQEKLDYTRNRFSNPQVIQDDFLSLQNKNYLPPQLPEPEIVGIPFYAGRDDPIVVVDSSVYDFSSSHPDGYTQVSFLTKTVGIGPSRLQWYASGYTPLRVPVFDAEGQKHILNLRGKRLVHWDVAFQMNTGANYYNYTDSKFRLEYHQSDNLHLNGKYSTSPNNPLVIMAQGWHRRDFNEEILFSIDVEIP